MDWQGQKLAEQIMEFGFLAAMIVSLLAGFLMSSIKLMLVIYGVFVLAILLCVVPNWGFFNRHPLKFLDPSAISASEVPQAKPHTASRKASKASKK